MSEFHRGAQSEKYSAKYRLLIERYIKKKVHSSSDKRRAYEKDEVITMAHPNKLQRLMKPVDDTRRFNGSQFDVIEKVRLIR